MNIAFLIGIFLLAGCQPEEIISPDSAIVSRDDKSISPADITSGYYGLGPSNQLYRFSLRPAFMDQGNVIIRGLGIGERIIAIDVRPATRGLYGISNMSRIYMIDPITGLTKPVSQTPFSPAIIGATVGFDFNPATGNIHVMSGNAQGLIIHPVTGQVIGTTIAVSGVNGIAYSNNIAFIMNGSNGSLYRTDITGNLKFIGNTGLTISGDGGFDSKNGITVGAFLASGIVHNSSAETDDLMQEAYRIYSIDLSNGQASNLGRINPMIGLAAQ